MELADLINPLDYRYYGSREKLVAELGEYLSAKAYSRYLLKVESALVKVLAKKGICSEKIADEIEKSCSTVTYEEILEEENKTKHDIRGMVNLIKRNISEEAKPFVHFTATSYDIVSTAEALRYTDTVNKLVVPNLLELEKTLIELAEREKNTVQIGRTHGQHAVPITFGLFLAGYVSRLGRAIEKIRETGNNLRGKFSGAVGAYNASSMFFENSIEFEKMVMDELGLKASLSSTQIVEPEYLIDLMHQISIAFGVLANLADDMRNLQRSEINEVMEEFEAGQVGSSTMPHKRNPINFENVKSMWKAYVPRMGSVYLDQISEHQRDLTNSASSRFLSETFAGLILSAKRMNSAMKKIVVDKESMKRNFDRNGKMIVAEPLYLLLAANRHSDAHEYVRKKTLESEQTGKDLKELVFEDPDMAKYLSGLTERQKELLEKPENYIGKAVEKTEIICAKFRKLLN